MKLSLMTLLLLLAWSAPAWAQAWPALDDASAAAPGPEDVAVIIGVEDYAIAPDIPGAAQNARDWYTWFTKGRQIPTERVQLLLNNYGTLEKMRGALSRAAEMTRQGGTLWVIYIGHGAPAADGKDGVLVGYDAQQDPESLYARSLKQAELLKLLSQGKQSQTVVLLDACFSGQAPGGAPLAPGLQPLLPVQQEASQGALVLSAGANDQFAGPLPGADRPAFSYLMLGALHGWADADQDQQVTAREALNYTRGALTTLVQGRQQIPQASGDLGLPLTQAQESAPGPDLAQMVLATRGDGGVTVAPPGDPSLSLHQPISQRAAPFAGPDALNIGLQLGVGAGSSSYNGLTISNTDGKEIDETIFRSTLALQLAGQSTWLDWDVRLGGHFGSDQGIMLNDSGSADFSGLFVAASGGLNLLSWPNAGAAPTSLLNLSTGLDLQVVTGAVDAPFDFALYLANTFYLDCTWFAQVGGRYFLIDQSNFPDVSVTTSFGFQTGRSQACR